MFRARVATLLFRCKLLKWFHRESVLINRSGIVPALKCSRQLQQSAVFNPRTKGRGMPKTGKAPRNKQQGADSQTAETEERKEEILSVISDTKDGHICVKIQAKPGAKQSNITDISADGVSIQIGAPAKEGEANEELVRYLAEVLSVRKRSISLDKGSKSRQKVVMIDPANISLEQVRERLSREVSQG